MFGVNKNMIIGSALSVFITLGFSMNAGAQNLRLTPPQIDYASCAKIKPQPDDIALKLKSSQINKTAIDNHTLLLTAILFKNGSGKVMPDITKAVDIIEYLITKQNIEPVLKARALKIKAELMYYGEGYTRNTSEAKRILADVIKNTDPTATLNLAKMLEVEGKFTEAEAMYKKALKFKDPVAALALAYMYHNKDIVVPQTTTDSYVILAQNMLLEKLASGQCDYFGKIGFMYMNLRGLADNEKLAAEWLLPASRFNHARSKQQLAKLINKGYLSEVKNKPTEIELLEQSAALGLADSMHDLGQIFIKNSETQKQAIAWLKKSGERQNIQAIERLIKHYKNELSARDDYIYWLDKASKHDDIDHELLVDYADVLKQSQTPDQTKIFVLYKQAARLGNDEAMFEMGEAYKYGLGVEKDPTKALRFYRLAAQKSNLDAFESMVDAYECGIGKTQNNAMANKWKTRGEYYGLSSIYNKMDAEIQSSGNEKLTLVQNYIPQLKLIARDKKSIRAMVRLSVMYEFIGDKKQSQSWLDRAMRRSDNGEAMYHYATELKNGTIVPTNIEKSNNFMKQAADKNNKSALKRIGKTLEKQKNYAEALEIFKQSYALGDQSNVLKIADMERELGNDHTALSYLKKASSYNDAEAMFELAKAYSENGWVKPSNPELSKEWFNRATQSYICGTGDIIEIAASYIEGKNGADKNLKMAGQWLSRILSLDTLSDGDRLNYISLILESVSLKHRPEYKMALADLESMAKNENVKAIRLMGEYYLNTTPNAEKALYWLTKSANNNNTDAMLQLGKLHMAGHLVEQSQTTASQWFEKAANDNNLEAIKLLKAIKNP